MATLIDVPGHKLHYFFELLTKIIILHMCSSKYPYNSNCARANQLPLTVKYANAIKIISTESSTHAEKGLIAPKQHATLFSDRHRVLLYIVMLPVYMNRRKVF